MYQKGCKMTEFVLTFDIPTEEKNFKLKINRELNAIGARMLQRSVWQFDDLQALIRIATLIKSIGGSALILEKKFLFS
jgi:hypothetical protein